MLNQPAQQAFPREMLNLHNIIVHNTFILTYGILTVYLIADCMHPGADLKYVKQVVRRSENYLTQNIFRAAFQKTINYIITTNQYICTFLNYIKLFILRVAGALMFQKTPQERVDHVDLAFPNAPQPNFIRWSRHPGQTQLIEYSINYGLDDRVRPAKARCADYNGCHFDDFASQSIFDDFANYRSVLRRP